MLKYFHTFTLLRDNQLVNARYIAVQHRAINQRDVCKVEEGQNSRRFHTKNRTCQVTDSLGAACSTLTQETNAGLVSREIEHEAR